MSAYSKVSPAPTCGLLARLFLITVFMIVPLLNPANAATEYDLDRPTSRSTKSIMKSAEKKNGMGNLKANKIGNVHEKAANEWMGDLEMEAGRAAYFVKTDIMIGNRQLKPANKVWNVHETAANKLTGDLEVQPSNVKGNRQLKPANKIGNVHEKDANKWTGDLEMEAGHAAFFVKTDIMIGNRQLKPANKIGNFHEKAENKWAGNLETKPANKMWNLEKKAADSSVNFDKKAADKSENFETGSADNEAERFEKKVVKRSDDVSPLEIVVQQQAAAIQTMQTKLDSLVSDVAKLKVNAGQTVAFSVLFSTDPVINVGFGATLRFDVVKNNLGSAYNRDTGMFTAPVPGLYVFFIQIMGSDDHPWTSLAIIKTGNVQLDYKYTDGNEDVHSQTSGLATTHLVAGEEVWVKHASGSTVFRGGAFTTFSGFLVHADF